MSEMNSIAADAREVRGRAAYEAAQRQSIFAYGLFWNELEPIERQSWCEIADALAGVEARQLAVAHAAEAYWQQAHFDAVTQIGRLDYALEQIGKAKTLRDVRQWVTRMRAEIKARTTPKEPA